MSFPSPSLDDRTFQDLVSEAKRLIPRYTPEWTNHNVADPGVALLELFAWMTEGTIYRLNQVPDRWYVKFLELVGIRPYAAVPARTVLTFWLSAPQAEAVVVPADTQVGTLQTGDRPSVVFSTDEPVRIVQPDPGMFACVTGVAGSKSYQDRWKDLDSPHDRVQCFPRNQVGDAVYFGFRESLAANVLYAEVDAEAVGVGIDPARPPLAWEAWTGEAWEAAEIEPGGDRTGGLNRRGSILMFLPFEHEPSTLGATEAHWLRARLAYGKPEYERSPEINSITFQSLGGRARATQGLRAPPEVLGRSDGTPGQVFRVENTPVLPRRKGETVRIVTTDGVTTWTEVEHFGNSGPDDRHFTWDSTTGEIRFGPEVRYREREGRRRRHGAIPPRHADVTVSGYRFGGGAVGNVGAGTVTVLRETNSAIERAENRKRATGGVDTESVDNAKLRGPLTLATGGRAVTAADFEHLTMRAARSVARARCARVEDPDEPIRVLVVPRVDVAPRSMTRAHLRLEDHLVEEVVEYLSERKLLGRQVVIQEPTYVGISAVARLVAQPGIDHQVLEEQCLDALYGFIDPLSGGPDGTGWPFGWDVHVGGLYQRLMAVAGVEEVEDVLIFAADPDTGERFGRGLDRFEIPDLSLFASVRHYVLVLDEPVTRP